MGETREARYSPRTWLVRAWDSPLGRRVDRAEAVVVLITVAVALLVVPLTLLAHKHVRSAQDEATQQHKAGYGTTTQTGGLSAAGSFSAGEPYVASRYPGSRNTLAPAQGTPPSEGTTGDASGDRAGSTGDDAAVVFADVMTGGAWLVLVTAGYVLARRSLDRRRMAGLGRGLAAVRRRADPPLEPDRAKTLLQCRPWPLTSLSAPSGDEPGRSGGSFPASHRGMTFE